MSDPRVELFASMLEQAQKYPDGFSAYITANIDAIAAVAIYFAETGREQEMSDKLRDYFRKCLKRHIANPKPVMPTLQ